MIWQSPQSIPVDCQWRGNRGCYFPSAGLSVLSLGSVWGPGLGGVWTNSCPPFCGQVRSRSWLSGYTFSLILWPHFVVYGSYNSGRECGLVSIFASARQPGVVHTPLTHRPKLGPYLLVGVCWESPWKTEVPMMLSIFVWRNDSCGGGGFVRVHSFNLA